MEILFENIYNYTFWTLKKYDKDPALQNHDTSAMTIKKTFDITIQLQRSD